MNKEDVPGRRGARRKVAMVSSRRALGKGGPRVVGPLGADGIELFGGPSPGSHSPVVGVVGRCLRASPPLVSGWGRVLAPTSPHSYPLGSVAMM